MGVYIKGMDMPKHDDEYVIFTVYGDGGVVYGPMNRPHVRYKNRAIPAADVRPVVTCADCSSDWLNTRDIRTLAQFRDAAVCVDSPIGEYRCQVEIRFSAQSGRKPIYVDTCLQHEIYELIRKHNVNTIGCCCGHGRKQAYIQVSPQSVQKMHELGYVQLPEKEDGQGKWCFKPKTYFLQSVSDSYKFGAKGNENTVPPYNDCANVVPPHNEELRNTLAEEGE